MPTEDSKPASGDLEAQSGGGSTPGDKFKFKVPETVWELSINGQSTRVKLKPGESVTPYYNPQTKKVTFKKEVGQSDTERENP